MSNANLLRANATGYDEFYTQLDTIEKELCHYEKHFVGKVVYCNCDDPDESMFVKFFRDNFKYLGLKSLITSGYKSQESDLFSRHTEDRSWYKFYENDEVSEGKLSGDGDFRSSECLDLLQMCDIVVTNPPFSLFKEYLPLLIEHKKKFLVLGNMNAVSYSQIWPLFREKKCWYGVTSAGKRLWFGVPEEYTFTGKLSDRRIETDGSKFVRMKGIVRWFTNLEHGLTPEGIILETDYNEEQNPKYDNYDAVEVGSVRKILRNYGGLMGVPVNFMDKYNPRQFEIVDYLDAHYFDGVRGFKRFIIRAKPGFTPPKPPTKTVVERQKRDANLRKKFAFKLYEQQLGKCNNTGCLHNLMQTTIPLDFMDVDHIVPVSKGGSNDLENLQLLCRKCNGKKSDKIPNPSSN